MSMNLCFDVKGGAGMVDFPFQTPEELTYAVLREPDNDKRLTLIRKACEGYGWSKEDIETTLSEIEALMKSPNLELSLI